MKKGSKNFRYLHRGKYGFVKRSLLKKLFAQIHVPATYRDSIEALAGKGHIVYAQNAQSDMDSLLLNFKLKEEGLPAPEIVLGHEARPSLRDLLSDDDGSDRELLGHLGQSNSASLMFMEQKEIILLLLKLQRKIKTPIYIMPQRLIYRRIPEKLRSKHSDENVTLGKKLTTLISAEDRGLIEHGDPINLKDLVAHSGSENKFIEEIASDVHNDLQHRLAALRHNITGAPIRSRDFIINKTMKDPVLVTYLRTYAAENDEEFEALQKRVNKNLNQIAADLNPTTINVFKFALTFIFNNIYDGMDIDKEGLARVKEKARRGSIVYVPCHKSHIDYLVLSYGLFFNWMSIPLIAAGINLAFFPMGYFFRRGGAFFMRRTFKGDPVYAQTFSAYIRTILGERIPMEFFIEGTRSRSGKLMLPKKGLLSMIVQGWESGITRNVYFVPVYVGYDRVVEEGAYVREMKGAPKEKENLWSLLKAGKVLKQRYGKVYVRFAEPISMNAWMKQHPPYSHMEQAERQQLYDDLADDLIDSIYKETVATPLTLLSSILISRPYALDADLVKEAFILFATFLKESGCNMASSLDDFEKGFNDTVKVVVDKGLMQIDREEDSPDIFTVDDDKRINLEYYKNTTLNFFVPSSLISNVLIRFPEGLDEEQFTFEVKRLADLLDQEFILDMGDFKHALKFMIRNDIVLDQATIFSINPEDRRCGRHFGCYRYCVG